MSPRQLRRLAAREPVRARVISDGCRDYLVEVVSDVQTDLLRDAAGANRRFKNLGEVHGVLRSCGVEHAVLRHRVAQDEAVALEAPESYHDQPLRVARG